MIFGSYQGVITFHMKCFLPAKIPLTEFISRPKSQRFKTFRNKRNTKLEERVGTFLHSVKSASEITKREIVSQMIITLSVVGVGVRN